jgi:hypothetical protein
MHGGFDAVEHLEVQFGELVFLVGGGFLDITEGGGIDDVADNESLDGLVLGDCLSGGNASHTLDVSATVLVSSVVTSLDSHDEISFQIIFAMNKERKNRENMCVRNKNPRRKSRVKQMRIVVEKYA